MPNAHAYERAFVARCVERAQTLGLSHSELARRAWPNHGDPGRRWRTIRNGTARLTMDDAISLGNVLWGQHSKGLKHNAGGSIN